MKNNINIVEILKDCPKGMELDCILFNNPVKYDGIDIDDTYPIKILTENDESFYFTKEGYLYNVLNSKCLIFPKGKTTWEGFQRSFEDGDVVATTEGLWIGITTGGEEGKFIPTYCVVQCDDKFEAYLDRKGEWAFSRLATEEEKQKIFDAIKDNGYHWNAETKTLEKLLKFKIGDIYCIKDIFGQEWYSIIKKCENDKLYTYVDIGISDNSFYCEASEGTCYCKDIIEHRFATEEEKAKLFDVIKENGYKWNYETKTLEKLVIKQKFKVGDCVVHQRHHKYGKGEITKIHWIADEIVYETRFEHFTIYCKTNDLCKYELVPNKFDVTNFEPFMKVLVRSDNSDVWECDFFSSYNPKCSNRFHCIGAWYNICIPYIGNEHLCGTTDDCDDFYKTWG